MASFEIVEVEDEDCDISSKFEEMKTSRLMTKYEFTRLIATRAVQIERGFPILINKKDYEGIYDPLEIAKREVIHRKINLAIKRILPDGSNEIFYVKDMDICDY